MLCPALGVFWINKC